MGSLKNNMVFKVGVGAINEQSIPKMTDISISKSVQEIEAIASCDLSPWFSAEASKEWSGSVTIQAINPTLLATMLGGSEVTTGYLHVKDESITTATGVDLANTSALEDSVIVTADNGAKMYKKVASTPGDGEYAWETDRLVFNGSESETTVQATYAYADTGAHKYTEDKDDTSPYCSLYLAGCGELVEDGSSSYTNFYFPRVKVSNFNWGASNGDVNSVSFDFKAVTPVDGSNIVEISMDSA